MGIFGERGPEVIEHRRSPGRDLRRPLRHLMDEIPHPVLKVPRPPTGPLYTFAEGGVCRRDLRFEEHTDHPLGIDGREPVEQRHRGFGRLQPVGSLRGYSQRAQPLAEQIGILPGRGESPRGDRLHAAAKQSGIGGRGQRRHGHAKQAPGPRHRLLPLVAVGGGLLLELPGVVERGDAPFARPPVHRKRHPVLGSVDENDQVLGGRIEPHPPRLVDPAPQLFHGDSPRILGAAAGEVLLPMLADDEVGAVVGHFADEERVGDLPQERPLVPFDRRPAVAGLRRLDRPLENGREVLGREHRARLGRRGKLPHQRLAEKVVEGLGKRSLCRRAEGEARGERLEAVGEIEIVRLIDDAGGAARPEAVGDVHRGDELAAESVTLVFEDPVGRRPRGGREVGGEAIEAVAIEDMLEDGQAAEVVERPLGEEGGYPADRLRRALRPAAFVELGEIVAGGEVLLVEGKVDHHLPVVGGIGELIDAHVAHVPKHHLRLATDPPPRKLVGLLEERRLLDSQGLLEDDLANDLHPVAVAVFGLGPLEDAVGVDVSENDGDRGIAGIARDPDLADLGRPRLHLVAHRLHLAADDWRRDRAVVEGGEPLGGHPPQ